MLWFFRRAVAAVEVAVRLVVALAVALAVALGTGATVGACARDEGGTRPPIRLVFKHGKIAGRPDALRGLLDRFEASTPGVEVVETSLPSDSDEQHRFYVINLEGGAPEFDVMALDVIWISEFARAGWIRPLDGLLSDEARTDFFSGTLDAVMFEGHAYAIPWFADAGVLYARRDLLAEIGLSRPPRTWTQLRAAARQIRALHPELYGFVWQGKQYEGLVCNALEYIWGAGGRVVDDRDGHVVLDSPRNEMALRTMRGWIEEGLTPASVTTMTEEPARHLFQAGRAAFMRNWPYAYTLLQQEGSAVRGKVVVTRLPTFEAAQADADANADVVADEDASRTAVATLGGWHLAVNAGTRHPEIAERFVRFMTSAEAAKTLALSFGYQPARRSVYDDAEIRANAAFIPGLPEILERARPRPVTPYYLMMSKVLQLEFSAVVSGLRPPRVALERSAVALRHLMGEEAHP
ncbi:MAG: ABC transporter substrate-binding protein [Deltaproteobacteria bacterium]|nr:ABC transporter substrate-binding protein [Deltaproteobacteria bacterium]